MESSKKLSLQEPGAERRQAISDAIREMSAEKIEKKAYGWIGMCIACQIFNPIVAVHIRINFASGLQI